MKAILKDQEKKEQAVELAEKILKESDSLETDAEKKQREELALMVESREGKALATALSDQFFRTNKPGRVVDQIIFLLNTYGIPNYLGGLRRAGLHIFKTVGKVFPHFFASQIKNLIREETAGVILPAEKTALHAHIKKRIEEGVDLNLNHLGEAVLGEKESQSRLEVYLNDLKDPNITYVSVKISTIFSQINLISWESSLEILSERYRKLLRAANENEFTKNGRKEKKFVNLDMEEYRDLDLTIALFQKVLSEPEFLSTSAGIVLQAYLPDSFDKQKELTEWAIDRVKKGGAPIKIRIVKGANLAMEKVESSLKGWPQAPFTSKAEVDANFKKMLDYGLKKERAQAVHLGIGSHNLFDISYAFIEAEKNGSLESIVFEMLEGMADHYRRALQKYKNETLLYCPVAREEDYQNAVAYLVRRLDENTSPENFLRYSFNLKVDSPAWKDQKMRFEGSLKIKDSVSSQPRRTMNRFDPPLESAGCKGFENEADTDFSLKANREWALGIYESEKNKTYETVPLVINGEEIISQDKAQGIDPSQPNKTLYSYSLAKKEDIESALVTAERLHIEKNIPSLSARILMARKAAKLMREKRADLIGLMIANTGKTIYEADPEVSEAIDFCNYYAENIIDIHFLKDIEYDSIGPVLVAPPWNFPCAIPAGGVIGALLAGNPVILKPAKEAVLVGYAVAKIFWEAGFDKKFLQFIACEDDPEGSRLVKDPRLKKVILTGSSETAKHLIKLSSTEKIYAETGGKNAIIVSNMADRDLAVKDIVQSAFGHSGQKCSACSLAILHSEVYRDETFLKQLKDAVESLVLGSAWDPASKVTPLITNPSPHLLKALTELEEGESWLVEPKQDKENPQLFSPGVKLGVKKGSFSHQVEFFGPILSVIEAENLEEAIDFANSTPYGLTSGLHTLDPREREFWKKRIVAGNLYINRGITGAIVQRQPFGGCKASQFGTGHKAGGPNYIISLLNKTQKLLPDYYEDYPKELEQFAPYVKEASEIWERSLKNYSFFWKNYFSLPHDRARLLGQDNLFYYAPEKILLRIQSSDDPIDYLRVIAACLIVNAPLEISSEIKIPYPCRVENEESFIARIKNQKEGYRIRILSEPSDGLQAVLNEKACTLIQGPVLANGRIELLNYLREVALSFDYHRYGFLGDRENEGRTPLPLSVHDENVSSCCQGGCACR